MAVYTTEKILEIQQWSAKLFSFRTTRARGLRFENGQFVMLGLQTGDRKIVRAYSIASSNYEDHLEFYSIKVPDGALTSRLQHVVPGSDILISSKPTGTLVLRDLRPGKRLFLLATGTGIAPFLSIVKDPMTYESFEQVVVAHGVRIRADLAYANSVIASLQDDADLGALVRPKLLRYACVSRESSGQSGRVTTALATGNLCSELDIPPLNAHTDRLMLCGNIDMLAETRGLLDSAGFEISPQIGVCGDYVIERAFTESLQRKAA
ncbi:MAG TPA: ferredoxin--NADP reductase [Steroidobacteraceae bacterium]